MISSEDFTLRLAEHIQGVWFAMLDPEVQENFKNMLGVDPDALMEIQPPELDMGELTDIAEYLINEEELGDVDIDQLLMVGLFIHGYIHREDEL